MDGCKDSFASRPPHSPFLLGVFLVVVPFAVGDVNFPAARVVGAAISVVVVPFPLILSVLHRLSVLLETFSK